MKQKKIYPVSYSSNKHTLGKIIATIITILASLITIVAFTLDKNLPDFFDFNVTSVINTPSSFGNTETEVTAPVALEIKTHVTAEVTELPNQSFSFPGRVLEAYRINPSETTFSTTPYWDGSLVRFLDFQYIYQGDVINSGISKIKYAYIYGVYAKSATPPEIDIETLPVSFTPFNILSSFEVAINHERVDSHYHYDHYFIVLEDYSGNIVIDYLNVLWTSGNDEKNQYAAIIINDEDWDDEAYLTQNEGATTFAQNYNLYKGEPRPELMKVTQYSLDALRQIVIDNYGQITNKIPCDEIGNVSTIVLPG